MTSILLAVVIASTAAAQSPAAGPLAVRIVTPQAGIVAGPVVELEATVSDPAVREALLEVNGQRYHVSVEQGRIAESIVAIPGNNRVGVIATRRLPGSASARDSLTFRYDGEPMELVVLLTWPSRGEIVDLWVREPGGETCKWDHRETATGGHLLDFSSNAIGFGSQAFVLPEVRAGRFRVKVHYWGGFGDDDERGSYTYSELMNELDEADRALAGTRITAVRRRELEANRVRAIQRLDAWATPGAPQTPVHADVVLFPGTEIERRYRFDVVVDRVGELTTVGEVEIDAALVARARRSR